MTQTPRPMRPMDTAKDIATLMGRDPRLIASLPSNRVRWHTDYDCRKLLHQALTHVLLQLDPDKQLVWLPQYDEVAEWLADNHGKGLLLYGSCGQGKTLIARYAIPLLLMKLYRKIIYPVEAAQMDANVNEYLKYHLISIDDLGTEVISQYRNLAFGEIIDRAEKKGGIVVITTNLTGKELKERYGDRIMDRILGLTKRVMFQGESLRK